MGGGASSQNGLGKIEWISKIPCFRSLDEEHMISLSSKVVQMDYKKGENIISEGQVGSLFGILVSGLVQISAKGPNDQEVVLCTQERGFYFGEAAIIGNTTTTATIKARTDCVVYGLMSAELQQLTKDMPEVKESLLSTVSHRLKQNILAIPFFAQLKNILESKKSFKMLGAFDLLSTLFELESFNSKETLFNEGDLGKKFYVICEGCIRISSRDSEGHDFMLSMLKKYDVFGEIALVEHTKRTATAKAFEPSLVLSITKEKFDKLFEVFPAFRDVMVPHIAHRTANTLKRVKVFEKLSQEKMEALGGMMEFQDFEAGTILEEEGAYNAGLYIVIAGTIHALTKKEGDDQLKLLSEMGEGSVMGEMALLTGAPRSATLLAVTACLCLYLSAEKFRRFLPFAPELMDDLIFTAKCRRKKSIEINAEASLQIPNIDADVENKLYLYSLLRSKEVDELELSNHEKETAESEVKNLKDMNRQMAALNESKRQRVIELKERVSSMLKHVVPESFDIDEKLASSPRSNTASAKDLPSSRILQRRNSWTSNTDIEQHKMDLSNILKASSKQQLDKLTPFKDQSKMTSGGRRGRQVTGTINIDIEVDLVSGQASPSKALGKHFETFSAAAHQLEEELSGNDIIDSSRPSSRGSSRSFRNSAGSS
ncbi:hypothetical protein TrRE_jg13008 [Triparma retinervis]|uniref:Cyclic nucleotide-binding domain-containing protein n=1 Tax=Triparma retinervis TaxID=2557542 RepID=A0A9W7EBN2_9STRA|nr:hypothetical protein TrRE_jg13008 [Triparma retinervis]